MLTVVLSYWTDTQSAWRNTYTYNPEYVFRMIAMIERHLTLPHEIVVLTDSPRPFYGFRTVPIEPRLFVPGKRFQKLMIFRPDAAELFGERILMMDLDCVIAGNIDSLVDRPEDIVLWANPAGGRTHYNTSLILLRAGTRNQVWTEFDPAKAVKLINNERLSGTDQAWVSRILRDEATWTQADGVYSFKNDYMRQNRVHIPDARIISFHGRYSPALPEVASRYPWVREHYYGSEKENHRQTAGQ